MQPVPLHRYSFQDYLALEEIAGVRHEFLNGEIYAMAGGTPEHAAMAAAIVAQLGSQLSGGSCRVYSSDLRVRVLATGLATYPDATVVCGPSERDPQSPTHVINPRLLVEVLSPSTEDYDRGEKLEHYKKIPGLAAVLLFSHDEAKVTLWQHHEGAWSATSFAAGQTVELECVAAALEIDPIYRAAREA